MSFVDKLVEPMALSGVDGIISASAGLLGFTATNLYDTQVIISLLIMLISDGLSMSASYFNMKQVEPNDEEKEQNNQMIDGELIWRSLMNLVAFVVFGAIPIIVYMATIQSSSRKVSSGLAFVASLIGMSILGIIQFIIKGRPVFIYSTPTVGAIAGIIIFFIAPLIEKSVTT